MRSPTPAEGKVSMGTGLEIKADKPVVGDNKTTLGKRDGNVIVTVMVLKVMQWELGT